MLFPELSYARPDDRLMRRVVIRSMEHAAGRTKLVRLYAHWRDEATRSPGLRFHSMLSLMRIELAIAGDWPPAIPPAEPLVMVANHPFGIGDGATLLMLAETLGRPFRILVSNDLMRIEEMREIGLPVCFEETRAARDMNLETRREALRLLKQGVTIIVFPAGGVATAATVFGKADDLPWKQFTARLVRMGKATVLPIHVQGQNGPLFHLVSKWSKTLRYGLLIGAFRRLYGRQIRVTVGTPIPYASLDAEGDGTQLTQRLRDAVFRLASPERAPGRAFGGPAKRARPMRALKAAAAPTRAENNAASQN